MGILGSKKKVKLTIQGNQWESIDRTLNLHSLGFVGALLFVLHKRRCRRREVTAMSRQLSRRGRKAFTL